MSAAPTPRTLAASRRRSAKSVRRARPTRRIDQPAVAGGRTFVRRRRVNLGVIAASAAAPDRASARRHAGDRVFLSAVAMR